VQHIIERTRAHFGALLDAIALDFGTRGMKAGRRDEVAHVVATVTAAEQEPSNGTCVPPAGGRHQPVGTTRAPRGAPSTTSE